MVVVKGVITTSVPHTTEYWNEHSIALALLMCSVIGFLLVGRVVLELRSNV